VAIGGLVSARIITLIADNREVGARFDDFVTVWDLLEQQLTGKPRCFTAVLTIGELDGEEEAGN